MAATHDGVLIDLKTDATGLALALTALVGCTVAGALWVGWCVATPAMLVCALVALDRTRGNRRVRVTHTKLLVEDTRKVRGFLIGPTRRRVAWPDLDTTRIEGDNLIVRTRDGKDVPVVGGCTPAELTHLAELIERHRQDKSAQP